MSSLTDCQCVIALVGGSDLVKIDEQLRGIARSSFDFTFGENGLTAYKGEEALATQVETSGSVADSLTRANYRAFSSSWVKRSFKS